ALHVRARLGGRLPRLLLRGRSRRRSARPPRAPRRFLPGRLARAVAEDRGVSATDGLAVQVGLFAWERFQLRLPCLVSEERRREREGLFEFRGSRLRDRGRLRAERVLQGREGRRLPYLLWIRTRKRRSAGHVHAARSDAEGPQRKGTSSQSDG